MEEYTFEASNNEGDYFKLTIITKSNESIIYEKILFESDLSDYIGFTTTEELYLFVKSCLDSSDSCVFIEDLKDILKIEFKKDSENKCSFAFNKESESESKSEDEAECKTSVELNGELNEIIRMLEDEKKTMKKSFKRKLEEKNKIITKLEKEFDFLEVMTREEFTKIFVNSGYDEYCVSGIKKKYNDFIKEQDDIKNKINCDKIIFYYTNRHTIEYHIFITQKSQIFVCRDGCSFFPPLYHYYQGTKKIYDLGMIKLYCNVQHELIIEKSKKYNIYIDEGRAIYDFIEKLGIQFLKH